MQLSRLLPLRIKRYFVFLSSMRKTAHIAFALLLILLSSCNMISSLVHDDVVIAKVEDNKLYKSELDRLMPKFISAEDSTKLAERYINSWAMDHLYLEVAEDQLTKEEMDVSEELETYRLSLIKHRYEQRYINNRLDTLVTDEQVEEYYETHKNEYKLQRPILKVRFVDIMKDSPNKDAVLKLMDSEEYDDIEKLDSLAHAFALRYFDRSETWMDSRELALIFGMDYLSMLSHLKGNKISVEPEGRGDILVAYVAEIQKDGFQPIEYCSPTIRDIIISNRKNTLLKDLERDLLSNALESNTFEIIKNENQ